MLMSCKYYYRGGLCANSQMEKPFCVGEENCEYINKPSCPAEDAGSEMAVKPELELNTVVVQDTEGDSTGQWRGVYCPHYKRFFCTGGEDGCKTGGCETADDYHDALSKQMEKLK